MDEQTRYSDKNGDNLNYIILLINLGIINQGINQMSNVVHDITIPNDTRGHLINQVINKMSNVVHDIIVPNITVPNDTRGQNNE